MFKRALQRYATAPEPVTPYQKAAKAWNDRIGSARVQARNWRLVAFAILGLAGGLAGALAWQSAQSRITPYVVEVDQLGTAEAVGPAERTYQPTDAQIAYHLAQFIKRSGRCRSTRSLSVATGSRRMTTRRTAPPSP